MSIIFFLSSISFFFQAEDGIRDYKVTGVQTCALPIFWRRPFDVGDRVEIAKHKGDVIDVHLFQFTLNEIGGWVDADQSTGRIVHIPNQQVFTEALANYDKGFKYVWNEVPV